LKILSHQCLSSLAATIDKYITMKDLNFIAEELFNKIRGRFPSVTIGDEEGKVTNVTKDARYFDFDFKEGATALGKVSITLLDDSVQVMYSNDIVENQDEITKQKWYDFLKELRMFAKKRLLTFDTRNINKSNLDRRDYKFLATNRPGDTSMNESKLYGTSRLSYQDIGNARLVLKHSKPVDQERAITRTQNIESIYIESSEGERFKYPFKHINGARAMARHVAEGGNAYDTFGKHIVGLSEELGKLKKFKSYMNKSSVMAESLSGYVDVVNERIQIVKGTIQKLQKESFYKEQIDNFEESVMEEVPADVAENWIDQLTIRQFNEELKDVFPYIYKLVSEHTVAEELGPEDIVGEDIDKNYTVKKGDTLYSIARKAVKYRLQGMSVADAVEMIADENGIADPSDIQPGMELLIPYVTGAVGGDPETGEPITRGIPPEEMYSPEDLERLMNQDIHSEEIENAFEQLMGQFAEGVEMCPEACCGKPVTECSCGPDCPHCDCYEKNKMNEDETEGNEFAQKVQQMKAAGAKKGDKFKTSDGKEHTLEDVTEYVLSMYDRETGQFPKGETAVLTAVEKDYGEQYINPAKQFIEMINAKFEEFNGYKDPDLMDDEEMDESGILYKAGVKKYGKKGMQAIQSAAGKGASHEELGKIKDKHIKDDLDDIRRIAGI